MTTKYTKITRADNEPDFENVRLCDNMIKGTILGCNEINLYQSCQKHWNKLDSDQQCPKCEKAPLKSFILANTIKNISGGGLVDFNFALIQFFSQRT